MCKIAITGPRPQKLNNDYDYTKPLTLRIRRELQRIILANNCTELIAGMALGIDTVSAMIAITHQIPLTAAIPFHNMFTRWKKKQIATYHDILCNASRIVYIHDDPDFKPETVQTGYLNLLYQNRNQWMVDQLEPQNDILLSVWDGSGTNGGTKNCLKYAANKPAIKRPIMLNINPNDFRNIQKIKP